jgi:hypothetical protein
MPTTLLDPSKDWGLGPLGMSPQAQSLCMNITDLNALYTESFRTAVQLGWICLAIGFTFGLMTMYFYMQRKYGSS